MATVVKKNRRTQDEIRQGLGLSSGNGGTARIASTGTVRPSSGSSAAPAGWYIDPVPTASQIQGKPSEPISFSGPSQAVTQGVNSNVTVGQAPVAGSGDLNAPAANTNGSAASGIREKYNPFDETFQRRQFHKSSDTDEYYDLMKEAEESRPDAFQSRYEGTIQTILDGILNGGQQKFDVSNDANYQALYNQYAQQYQNQASRGMRDTMGAMQAATGGYGSTAATAAAGQAYDRAMEGLNGQNMALMQLAYQMHGDEQADRYRQLGAVTGLDDTDYARYRDTVGDWMNDRAYYASQYQNMYGNDWNQYAFDTNLDWSEYQDRANRAWQEFSYGDQREYQKERDAKSDYDAAFNRALSLAQNGLGIPATYGGQLEPETLQQLNALAAQVQAERALAMAGGGSGGGRRSGSGNGSGNGTTGGNIITQDEFNADYNDIYQTAYMQAKSGGKTDKEAEKAAKSEADEYKKFLNKNNYVVDNTSSRYKTVGDLQREERQAMEAVKKRKEGSK